MIFFDHSKERQMIEINIFNKVEKNKLLVINDVRS
jgi:hypothetical protein